MCFILVPVLLRSRLLSFQIFIDFLEITLLLITNLIQFFQKTYLNYFKFIDTCILWPIKLCLKKLPVSLEKILFCCFMVGCPINVMLLTLFKSPIFLLIFCLLVLSIIERGVLKYLAITVNLFLCFISIRFCFINLKALLLCVYKFRFVMIFYELITLS